MTLLYDTVCACIITSVALIVIATAQNNLIRGYSTTGHTLKALFIAQSALTRSHTGMVKSGPYTLRIKHVRRPEAPGYEHRVVSIYLQDKLLFSLQGGFYD